MSITKVKQKKRTEITSVLADEATGLVADNTYNDMHDQPLSEKRDQISALLHPRAQSE